MFNKNLDKKGRLIRLSVAIVLLLLAVWFKSWIAFLLALFTLFEAYMSWCVIYQIFGINHCPIESKKDQDQMRNE